MITEALERLAVLVLAELGPAVADLVKPLIDRVKGELAPTAPAPRLRSFAEIDAEIDLERATWLRVYLGLEQAALALPRGEALEEGIVSTLDAVWRYKLTEGQRVALNARSSL